MSFSLFSQQHNRQRRRTPTGCWWWGSFCWPFVWASPVSSWPSSFSSSQNRKIFHCYGSTSHRFSNRYFFIMPVICFCMKKNKDLYQSMIYMYHCFMSTAFHFDTQNYNISIIFYAQPLHCIRYQRKLKAATAMVYGEYEISEAYKDLSFFLFGQIQSRWM